MTIVPIDPWHIEEFHPRDEDNWPCIIGSIKEELFKPDSEVRGWAILLTTKDVGGLALVNPLWEGVAEANMLLGENPLPAVWMTFAIRNRIPAIMESMNLFRLQVTVRSDHPERTTWMSKMGFRIEGILRRYGPDGCDCYMMAIVK